MKALTFILLILTAFFFVTCKKDGQVADNTFTGKWKMSETLSDPGDGSGKWLPVTGTSSTYYYVQFDSDGKLEGNAFSNYVSYIVKDSVTLTFTSKDNVLQNYRYSIKNGTIEMSPDGPIRCIEACGTRYVKIK